MEHAPAFAEPCAALERCLQVFLPICCKCRATVTPQLIAVIEFEMFQLCCVEPLAAELFETLLTRVQCRVIGCTAFPPTCLAYQFAASTFVVFHLLLKRFRGDKETVASVAF